MLLLWGRGSEEPENMGPRVGLPLSVAFAKMLGDKNVAVQGVYKYDGYKYPAILKQAENGGSKSGSQAMAHLIAKWKDTCPETRLVIGGYSQGAQVRSGIVQLTQKLPHSPMSMSVADCRFPFLNIDYSQRRLRPRR